MVDAMVGAMVMQWVMQWLMELRQAEMGRLKSATTVQYCTLGVRATLS